MYTVHVLYVFCTCSVCIWSGYVLVYVLYQRGPVNSIDRLNVESMVMGAGLLILIGKGIVRYVDSHGYSDWYVDSVGGLPGTFETKETFSL